MADAPRRDPAPLPVRLEGWKEIGAYFGRDQRTAQRWEKEGLPVYREGGKVFARTDDLEFWRSTRVVGRAPEESPTEVAAPNGSANGTITPRLASEAPFSPVRRWQPRHLVAVTAALALTLGFAAAWILWPKEVVLISVRQLTRDSRQKVDRVLSDGNRVFFIERAGSQDLTWAPVSGDGAVATVPLPFRDPQLLAFSSRRHSLLLFDPAGHRLFELAVASLVGSDLSITGIPLTETILSGAWDPAARRLALASTRRILLIGPTLAVQALPLGSSGIPFVAGWRPSTAELRVDIGDVKTGQTVWYDVDPAHPVARRLPPLSTMRTERGGDWSSDGKLFVFQARDGEENEHAQLWLADYSTGAAPRSYRLTSDDRMWRDPSFVPGTHTVIAAASPSQGRLARLGVASGGEADGVIPGAPAYELEYSRDGRWVAYTQFPEHTIWRATADGGEALRLTPVGMEAHQPHWSPDGTRIAFMARQSTPDAHWRIYIVSSHGGALDQILHNGNDQGVPTWSQDGRRLFFGDLKSNPDVISASLHELDLATASVSDIPAPVALWSPRNSPDGRYLAAVTYDSKALLVRNNHTGVWHKCASMDYVGDPVWPADSSWIQFQGVPERGKIQLYRVGPACGPLTTVLDISGYRFAGAGWIGIAPDNSPLGLISVPDEIFALRWDLRRRVP